MILKLGVELHICKEVNKRFEIYDNQMKGAKRSGNWVQQEKSIAAKEASKNKATGKVDEDETLAEAPKKWRDYGLEFHFPEPTELTPPFLQLVEVSFSYPQREDFKLSGVDIGIDMGTRVAIVGPNGAGMSTRLNLLAGDLVPSEDEVRRNQKLRIGRYSQHFVDLLTMDETPFSTFSVFIQTKKGLAGKKLSAQSLENMDSLATTMSLPLQNYQGGAESRVLSSHQYPCQGPTF
ncbi:unnamed protein product [Prunus armeniaca]|uniref:ABC transporter domain-containing protein n=1 Tax=Prunus armeniaca TaxID=36596 RepID=A0A6J5TYY2_PRUAR|nr:unnamed protein product [Prunus armeniaca]